MSVAGVSAWETEGGSLATVPARAPAPRYRLVPPRALHSYPALGSLVWRKHAGFTNARTQRIKTMIKNSEYVARMETQLKNWDADLDALAAKGERAGAEARAAYQERIAELRASRGETQKAFQEMSLATEAAGAKMQAGMQVAWETMRKALEKVSADLRK
jgi:hypothetical protein